MKKKWERAKDILFVVICVYVFVRIALPEQYMLLRGGVLGKRILWEESCCDTFYGDEYCKVFLYQSHDGEKPVIASDAWKHLLVLLYHPYVLWPSVLL